MNNKQQLIVLQGLPASGKSTFAKKIVEKNPKTYIRVNRDDIRHMMGSYWVPSREDLITIVENDIIISALCEKYNVIVDATNLKGDQRFKQLLKDYGLLKDVNVKLVSFFDVDVEECIRRDKERSKRDQVGEQVIRRFAKKYEHLINKNENSRSC